MKKRLTLLLVLAGTAALFVGVWLMSHSGPRSPSLGNPLPTRRLSEKSSPSALSVASPTNTSDAERLRYLEQLGHLPYPITTRDIMLGAKTTWWGKPLDSEKFWAGKVVWCDKIAKDEAAAHGRAWPPIPYEDPALPSYPDDDGFHGVGMGSEGVGAHSAYSSKEAAFWAKFTAAHPKPPETLESQQGRLAKIAITRSQARASSTQAASRYTQDGLTIEKNRLINDLGFPGEAFSDTALFWAYVMKSREEYRRLQTSGTSNAVLTERFFRVLLVDPKYVTDPLSSQQIEAADEWKTTYLQRLRREGTNETYITAYLRAWELTPEGVFK